MRKRGERWALGAVVLIVAGGASAQEVGEKRVYPSAVSASEYQNVRGHVHPPGHAIDGNPATRWSAKGDGQWITFELPEAAYHRVALHWLEKRTTTFDIEVSKDGTTWEQVLVGQPSVNTGGMASYEFDPELAPEPMQGMFIRIIGRENENSPWNSLVEAEFYAVLPEETLVEPPMEPPEVPEEPAVPVQPVPPAPVPVEPPVSTAPPVEPPVPLSATTPDAARPTSGLFDDTWTTEENNPGAVVPASQRSLPVPDPDPGPVLDPDPGLAGGVRDED